MRKNKDLIVFEIAAFNPRTGEAYIVDDGLYTLRSLVDWGRQDRRKSLSKKYLRSYWGRRLTLTDRILEQLIIDAEYIHLQLKIKPKFLKLLKELEALNKEADK